jgi:hypothetical protein
MSGMRHKSPMTAAPLRAHARHEVIAAPGSVTNLCTVCHQRPRLSSLRECVGCLTKRVEADRRARAARKASNYKAGPEYPEPSPRRLCGAHARSSGKPCKATAMKNGRCRYHGGASTGIKTAEGRARQIEGLKRWHAERRAEKLAAQNSA